MVAPRPSDDLFAGRQRRARDADLAHMRSRLEPASRSTELRRARAAGAAGAGGRAPCWRGCAPASAELALHETAALPSPAAAAAVARSGYTGEDGFEISVAAGDAEAWPRRCSREPEVAPAGLGARDTLRLEAGLCLYGHDIDDDHDPDRGRASPGRSGKRRRGAGGFSGRGRDPAASWPTGAPRKRVGLRA